MAAKTIARTDFQVTLGHVTQRASLAKIDPVTDLAYTEGPGRNRYITMSARHSFRFGFLQRSVSKADARDLSDGTPVPEAPRMIVDVLGTLDRLPFGLYARAEFEEVGRKPLGDGFVGVPVREFGGALVRNFQNGKVQAGLHLQIASGYTGQSYRGARAPRRERCVRARCGCVTAFVRHSVCQLSLRPVRYLAGEERWAPSDVEKWRDIVAIRNSDNR
jgi:hypothetical protein